MAIAATFLPHMKTLIIWFCMWFRKKINSTSYFNDFMVFFFLYRALFSVLFFKRSIVPCPTHRFTGHWFSWVCKSYAKVHFKVEAEDFLLFFPRHKVNTSRRNLLFYPNARIKAWDRVATDLSCYIWWMRRNPPLLWSSWILMVLIISL